MTGKYCFLLLFVLCSFSVNAQSKNKTLYVVDSIPINPNDVDLLILDDIYIDNNDIYKATTVSDKKEITELGYKSRDTIVFITTKEYQNRFDFIKLIPTSDKFLFENNRIKLKSNNKRYTGEVRDYYYSGRCRLKGHIVDGQLSDSLVSYYEDGKTRQHMWSYKEGVKNGPAVEYFKNGKIDKTGKYVNGEKAGFWNEWYSTGIFKRIVVYENGKADAAPENKLMWKYYTEGLKYMTGKDYSKAINCFDKSVELNPKISEVYFKRGEAKVLLSQYEKAIKDFDIAIDLEPYYYKALAKRAFTRIAQYEAADTLNPTKSGKTPQHKEIISKAEKEKICSDLDAIPQVKKQNDTFLTLAVLAVNEIDKEFLIAEIKKYCY